MTTTNKYRPALSLSEIQLIITKLDDNPKLQGKLKLLLTKADLGITKPAFITAGTSGGNKQDILERLEGKVLSPQERREAAFVKYQNSPASCTGSEISLARTHMYHNSMMTKTEELAYEEQEFN